MLRAILTVIFASAVLQRLAFCAPAAFPVAAHSKVNIEWWYVNAHVVTSKDRHLALVGAFFRLGDGHSPLNSALPQAQGHYLIYAVTNLDKKTHVSYSLVDNNMRKLLQGIVPLLALTQPNNAGIHALLDSLDRGNLPPGNEAIDGICQIKNSPFRIAYGTNTITALNASDTSFSVDIGAGGADKMHLMLTSEKQPMAVNGNGETGLNKPSDMYYYSLTRCRVSGTVDTGSGAEPITSGEGWFDHQWGDSWGMDNDGWDWWGVQLTDGTDILIYRQRDLTTGKTYDPVATFMDNDGHETVDKDVVFTPDPQANWTSPRTGVVYPLAWRLSFPNRKLTLYVSAAVQDQEMQTLGLSGSIWEGACSVTERHSPVFPPGFVGNQRVPQDVSTVVGTAYMELVGYGDATNNKASASKM